MVDNSIYSKIEYGDAIVAKREILEMQRNLLNTMQKIESYKELRKKELMLKLKLKNNLKEIRERFIKINNHVPQTKGIKKPKIIHAKMREKEVKRNLSIEEQLLDIQQKLSELH
ncbi:MAG: hypothetical protein WC781_02520 [Candidatus Pacearchaeota archaeon]|jgi:hypothetical protein